MATYRYFRLHRECHNRSHFTPSLSHTRISKICNNHTPYRRVITGIRVYTGKRDGGIQAGNCGQSIEKKIENDAKGRQNRVRPSLSYLSASLFLHCIVIYIISYFGWIYVSYRSDSIRIAVSPRVKPCKHAKIRRRRNRRREPGDEGFPRVRRSVSSLSMRPTRYWSPVGGNISSRLISGYEKNDRKKERDEEMRKSTGKKTNTISHEYTQIHV